MILQTLDIKDNCTGIFHNDEFLLDGFQELLDQYSLAWKHSPMLDDEKYKYLYLLVKEEDLSSYCHDPELFITYKKKLEAHQKAAISAKVSLQDTCFFDLLPEHQLLKWFRVRAGAMDNLQKIVLNADLVDFGPDLEDVKHMIELPEEQQRYDINTQINDIMNDLLSQYSLDKRSKKLMNSIHITIERYKQLREQYSLRNNEGVLTIPPPIQDDDKPLVHTLMHSKQPVDWILPVTKVKKIFQI